MSSRHRIFTIYISWSSDVSYYPFSRIVNVKMEKSQISPASPVKT